MINLSEVRNSGRLEMHIQYITRRPTKIMERPQEESFSGILVMSLLKRLCPHCIAVHLTQYSVHNGLIINSDMNMRKY